MKLKNFIIVTDVTNKFKYCSIQKIIVRIMLFKNHLLETIYPTRQSSMIQARILNFTLEDITSTIGKTTQLTAHITFITDDTEVEVNTGRVYLQSKRQNTQRRRHMGEYYSIITDNTATLDYNVPKTWNEDTEIEAVFTGNDEIPQKTSNTVNPTITAPETSETEFSVADATATAGEEIMITVTTKNIDDGKIVLKINGKTVKTADGKLYAKVTGESIVYTYTVPKTMKTGDYTVKAIYTNSNNKIEADGTLTVE